MAERTAASLQPPPPGGGVWRKDHKSVWPWRIGAGVVFPILWVLARTRLLHGERIPATGPVIIASNHMSVIDPLFVVKAVWKRGRLGRFLAKRAIWKVPVVGHVMTRSGQIPVDRENGASASLTAAERLVSTGSALIVYPEATLTRDPGLWPMRGKTGVARLALESGVPIVPVAHWGVQDVLPPYGKLRWWPWPRKTFTLTVGEPMDLSPWQGRAIDTQVLVEVTEAVMTAITELQAGLRGETPPAHRWDMHRDGDPYRRGERRR